MDNNNIPEELENDKAFQDALKKFNEINEKSQDYVDKLSETIAQIMGLDNENTTLEQARDNLVIAKFTAAKLLASITSFSYTEKDFREAIIKARTCITDEIVPTLIQQESCGQCENCKNGHSDACIRPHIREEYTESRFLPLIAEALIEYDIWNEVLYKSIPVEERETTGFVKEGE